MADTVRATYVEQLQPLLPKSWRIVTAPKNLDKLSAPVVMIKQQRFEPLPAAPAGSLLVTVVVTIADPHADFGKAEDALDDSLLELLTALDAHPAISWTEAEKVMFQDTYLAYDITTTINTQKEA